VGSSAKQRTTAAKLNREAKLRLRRAEKDARKAARKRAAAEAERDPVAGPVELEDEHESPDPQSAAAPAAGLGADN
jgi:hypothetical protein